MNLEQHLHNFRRCLTCHRAVKSRPAVQARDRDTRVCAGEPSVAWLGNGMALVPWQPPRRMVSLDIFDRGQQTRRRRRRNRTTCSLKINTQDKCTLIAVQDDMPYQLMLIRLLVVMQTVQSGLSFARSILFNGCHMNHCRVAVRGRGLCQDRSFASGSSLLAHPAPNDADGDCDNHRSTQPAAAWQAGMKNIRLSHVLN